MVQLIHIRRTPRASPKKLTAIFRTNNGHTRKIHFGAKGYSDFTKHKNTARRQRYINRHKARENFNNPMTPGALSRWILWNKPTIDASVKNFKHRFNL